MSFLSIAFLTALPLIAFPLVLHFFDRRRNVQIEWGAMQFLRSATTQQSRARKLKEWLLLLCRVAALAALIFALARPLVPGHWFGGKARTETIIVLDNSLSTARKIGDSTKLESLAERCRNLLRDLPDEDVVRVLVTSPKPTWMTETAIRLASDTKDGLVHQLESLEPTSDVGDLVGGLMAAVQVEPDPMFHKRKIVVLTDGQTNGLVSR